MVAALGPQLLKVTGRLADGTILWMTGPTTIEEHTVTDHLGWRPRKPVGPSPEIVAAFPDLCHGRVRRSAQRRQRGSERPKEFADLRNQLPSYRAMLDREGYEGPADLAIIGSIGEVEERIQAMPETGVTTFTASEFGSRDQRAATRELLVSML